jgi:hypothetical protein
MLETGPRVLGRALPDRPTTSFLSGTAAGSSIYSGALLRGNRAHVPDRAKVVG